MERFVIFPYVLASWNTFRGNVLVPENFLWMVRFIYHFQPDELENGQGLQGPAFNFQTFGS